MSRITREPQRINLQLADGRELSAWKWPGRGRTLVALHGLFDAASGWQGVAQRLDRPVLAFDLPGFGGSTPPERPVFSSYAREIGEGMRLLQIDRYDLVGHSLGGAVASYLSIGALSGIAPPRSLTLLAPAGYGKIPLAQLAALPLASHASGIGARVLLSSAVSVDLLYRAFVANGRAPHPELVRRLGDSAGAATPGARAALRALARSGMGARQLPNQPGFYEGPVVCVWGARDRLVPLSHIRGVKRALPQAEIRVWRNMGHHHMGERPRELAQLIERVQSGAPVPGRAPSEYRETRPAARAALA